MDTKNAFLCPHCGKQIDEGLINSWKARQIGLKTSEKKAASSVKNGKKGGRPRKIIANNFMTNAMKDGELYVLRLVNDSMSGSGAISQYRLVVCFPDGKRADAEHQPTLGLLPDILDLAEKNGFEVIDITDFPGQSKKGQP